MIKGNRLEFGYKDIDIRIDSFTREIEFVNKNVETNERDEESSIILDITLEEYFKIDNIFENILKKIDGAERTFTFKGYIFDFEKCDDESIKTLQKIFYQLISLTLWHSAV